MKTKRTSPIVGTALAAVVMFAAALPCAAATTHTVTSTDDNGSGTLREALENAGDGDTIMFDFTFPATITLTSGELVVDMNVAITGPGRDQLTVDGNSAFRVFHITNEKEVTISGLTIANGADEWNGGGIRNEIGNTLMLSDCALTGNTAVAGGAIFNEGSMTLTDCALSGNIAFGEPYNGEGEGAIYGVGGAILMFSHEPATLTLERCTLSDNLASGEGSISGAKGGAILVAADKEIPVTVTVTNSTLVGNAAVASRTAEAGAIANGYPDSYSIGADMIIRNSTLSGNFAVGETDGGLGGAIINVKGSLTLDNSTLADNYDNWAEVFTESDIAGGAVISAGGPLKIRNTILANHPLVANLFVWEVGVDSPVLDLGFNLCNDDCSGLLDSTTTLLGTAPLLADLADNGGPTLTHALFAGSPAIDKADEFDSAGNEVTTDQRGIERPQGIANDIGAFESDSDLVYAWSGVLKPLKANGGSVFKVGSTVPVKFRLTGWSAGIVDLQARLFYAMMAGEEVGTVIEAVSTSSATTGNLFRYDPKSGQYVFNWSTKGLERGVYRLFIDLGDGEEHMVDLRLK
jgi:hypothetical protein